MNPGRTQCFESSSPKNGWLGNYFPFGKAYFQGAFAQGRSSTLSNHSCHSPKNGSRRRAVTTKSGQCLKSPRQIWAFYKTPPKNDQFGPLKNGAWKSSARLPFHRSDLNFEGVYILTKDMYPCNRGKFPLLIGYTGYTFWSVCSQVMSL